MTVGSWGGTHLDGTADALAHLAYPLPILVTHLGHELLGHCGNLECGGSGATGGRQWAPAAAIGIAAILGIGLDAASHGSAAVGSPRSGSGSDRSLEQCLALFVLLLALSQVPGEAPLAPHHVG